MLRARFAGLGLLLAATTAMVPAVADASTTLTRYDFAATFDGDAVIRAISGFYTIQGDTGSGFGSLVDVGVTVGTTVFTMANTGGGRFAYTDQVSRAGGIIDPFDDYNQLTTGTYDFAVVIFDALPSGSFEDTGSYFLYTAEN